MVIENFSPGVMDRLGLGYETLRSIKPDIIMASISSTGQEGPLRDLRAYAPSIGALSGLDSAMGYEGGGPLGLKHAFGDICGALHAVFAIVSALYRRNRTGEGQYIDVSMLRATVVTQGAGLMEHALTGRALQPRGNYDPTMVPYGNYPCAPGPRWQRRQVDLHCRRHRRANGRVLSNRHGQPRVGQRPKVQQPVPSPAAPS